MAQNIEMRVRLPNWILLISALVCFSEIANAPRNSDPGPWLAAVLGILLLRRGILTVLQPIPVVISGCLLAALALAGDHALLNINQPKWIGITLALFTCYGLWERLERIWKPKAKGPLPGADELRHPDRP